jgi:hypothetical protein
MAKYTQHLIQSQRNKKYTPLSGSLGKQNTLSRKHLKNKMLQYLTHPEIFYKEY